MKRREINASSPQVEATTGGQSLGHAIRIRRRNPAQEDMYGTRNLSFCRESSGQFASAGSVKLRTAGPKVFPLGCGCQGPAAARPDLTPAPMNFSPTEA